MAMRRKTLIIPVIAALSLLPSCAYAQVLITEIMYDASGSDSGREWVEITNEGNEAVDISGYKFFENNTNHGLSVLTGSGVLAPQQSAVIVQDQVKFLEDFSSYSGTLLKSSFSLSNTGEQISIKQNVTALSDDEVTYDSSTGAAGDGNSLHRNDALFFAGQPTPGIFSEHEGTSSDPDSGIPETAAQTESPRTAGAIIVPRMTVDVGGDRTVEVGAGSFFEGRLYNAEGIPIPNARYFWNFGDGNLRDGQSVFYAYSYPGVYVVVLTVDAANGFATQGRITVTAIPAEVTLVQETDGSLTVRNVMHAAKELDLSLWILSRGGKFFTIPRGTIILPKQSVRFSAALLQLPDGKAELLYPSGVTAAKSYVDESHIPGITYSDSMPVPPAKSVSPAIPDSGSNRIETETQLAAAGVKDKLPWSVTLGGLTALIIMGIAGSLYARVPKESVTRSETDKLAEEFEIVEG